MKITKLKWPECAIHHDLVGLRSLMGGPMNFGGTDPANIILEAAMSGPIVKKRVRRCKPERLVTRLNNGVKPPTYRHNPTRRRQPRQFVAKIGAAADYQCHVLT
jgi:hypothetical protein